MSVAEAYLREHSVVSGDRAFADDQRRLLIASGKEAFVVHCESARDKGSLLLLIGAALQFPYYYSRNWDSLQECVRDLSWIESREITIFFAEADTLKTSLGDDLGVLASILADAARSGATTLQRSLSCTFVFSNQA